MEKNLKVVQIGCGKMSKYIMRYVYERGYTVVGAVDISKDIIGKDIGNIMDLEDKNIVVRPVEELDDILKETTPDIAVIATMSILNDIEEVARVCLKNKVNVITTCEEAFYPENSNPLLTKELDTLAKASGVTMSGCGYQDVFWGSLVTSICGSTHKITKIKGSSSYNVEDYGIALAKAHGAGYTKEQFDKEIAVINNMSEEEIEQLKSERNFFPSYMWNVVGWLADKLGFTIKTINQKCLPIYAEESIHSETLNLTLEKGSIRGMNAVVTALTEEGILFEVECIGKVYTEEEYDINEWTVFGEPTTKLKNDSPQTVELTCADIVNRLEDIVNADPGYVPTCKLCSPKYKK